MAQISDRYDRYKELKLALAGGIMTISLSNPGKKNAVTPDMSEELTTVWDDVLRDPAVRLIVLTGEGSDFCAGADFSQLVASEGGEPTPRPVHPIVRSVRRHMLSMLDCEKPVLAKVRGAAYGIGASLALGCDMVFAARGARFCDPHVKAGLVAGDGGILLWPALIGMGRAKEYLMTGDPVDAETAASIGLITRCVEEDDLDRTVQAMADKLLALPPHAVNYTKTALNLALRQMTGPAFEASLAYEIYSMTMEDSREAARAFVEKRKGNFTGT